MPPKRVWMSWVYSRKFFTVVLFALFLISCDQQIEEPRWIDKMNLLSPAQIDMILREKLVSEDPSDRAYANLKLCGKYLGQSDHVTALSHMKELEDISNEFPWPQEEARVNHLKAHIYWSLGLDPERVLEISEKALDKAKPGVYDTYAGNHTIYLLEAGQFTKVIDMQNDLIERYRSRGQPVVESQAVAAVAHFRLSAEPLDEEPIFGEMNLPGVTDSEALSRYHMGKAKELIGEAMANIGQLSHPLEQEHVYMRALEIGDLQPEDYRRILAFARQEGLVNLELEVRTRQPDHTIFGETQEEGLMRMAEASKKALEVEQMTKQRIAEYELARSARDKVLREEQIVFQQATYITALFGAMLVLLFLIIFFRAQQSANEARMERQDADILLSNYKNRIRPHFLFNQLNNVNGFITQEKWDDAQEYVGLLSVHLRSILEQPEQDLSTVGVEFDRIKNYVALQQKSSFDHVRFESELDFKSAPVKIPSGLLQPLIENSYKYAGNASAKNSWIKITAEHKGPVVEITVKDSGYGFLERIPGTGNGLTLVKDRIDFNRERSKKPDEWQFTTDFGKRESTVVLTMPSRLV